MNVQLAVAVAVYTRWKDGEINHKTHGKLIELARNLVEKK